MAFDGGKRRNMHDLAGPNTSPGDDQDQGQDQGQDQDQGELTWHEKAVMLCLMTSISFSSNLSVSLVLPFLPQELNAKGLPGQLLTGCIFAIFPLVILLFSPLCNLMAKRLGRIPMLYLGVPVQAVCVCMFGITGVLSLNKVVVVVLFLATRAVQGFGAACANLAIFAIISENFSNTLGKVMGFNEVIIGVGFMMGPVVGSLLYAAGGFSLPFMVAAGFLLVSFPVVFVYDKQQKARAQREAEAKVFGATFDAENAKGNASPYGLSSSGSGSDLDDDDDDDDDDAASFLEQIWQVLNWRLLLSALILFLGTGAFGWVETILSLHLQKELKFQQKYIGMIFAVINVTYSSCGPFIGHLADKVGYKPILSTGLTLTGLTFTVIGFSGALAHGMNQWSHGSLCVLNARRYVEVVMLALFGTCQTLCMIPTLPAMKESVPGKLDKHTINTVVMVFNQFQQGGLMFSPPLAGALAPAIGFETTMLIYGVICVGVGLMCGTMFGVYGAIPRSKDEGVISLLNPAENMSAPLLVGKRREKDDDHSENDFMIGSLSGSLRSPCTTTGINFFEEKRKNNIYG